MRRKYVNIVCNEYDEPVRLFEHLTHAIKWATTFGEYRFGPLQETVNTLDGYRNQERAVWFYFGDDRIRWKIIRMEPDTQYMKNPSS